MGRSSKTPPPPKIKQAPPAAEQLDPAVLAMFMRQQRSRRAMPYLTKGQRAGGDMPKPRTLTPQQAAKRAETIKTQTKDPLEGYVAPERAQVRGTGFDRTKTFEESDKSYETRDTKSQAEFLSKQSGIGKLKTPGEVAPELQQKLDEVPEGAKFHRRRTEAANKLNNAYNKYLEGYVSDAKKQLEKQYTTTQLRNLGIR